MSILKSLLLLLVLLVFTGDLLAQQQEFNLLQEPIPKGYYADDIYPNPYGFTTSTKFYSPDSAFVEIIVLNDSDEEVTEIYSGFIAPGVYFVGWNLKNSNGNRVPHGIYRFKISAHSKLNLTETKFEAFVNLPIIPD